MDHTQLTAAIADLRARYETLGTATLTRSILGREIPILSLGKGERTVVYVGTHHGTEHITAGVLLDFTAEYLRLFASGGAVGDTSVRFLSEKRRILVVPMLNPDGAEYAQHGVPSDHPLRARLLSMNGGSEDFSRWQANARGVDPERNYDVGFAAYKRWEAAENLYNGAPARYSGEYPESEPETSALCRLIRSLGEDFEGLLTFHTRGEEIFCSCADALSARSLSIGRILQRYTGYRLRDPRDPDAFGGLSDWCLSALRRPAYAVGCGKGEESPAEELRPAIYGKLRRALFAFPFLL